ncbi:hypothetical protein E3E14_10075 [Streptomyces sp. ICN441]|uniref:Uncharacterized protein n=1 Tax=Streptomyces marianii TaxID=1817406 RepID=A0A5R9EAN0_9ACTN|nr:MULTISPECIES: hypothetical protein [Streptomyces]TFE53189.1 hypothetical protein E3E14_10075 [Streptomyces sp. ICN441]TLQ45909.1 hypothetical protein FEF34_25530 [Streptomyces marianii]
MPATLVVSHPAPLSAPLSRTEVAEGVPSPCMSCGASVSGWGWMKVDGLGVLVHDTEDRERCPVAVPFVWETGKPVSASVEAVAA